MKNSRVTPATEDYLKAIYVLAEEDQPVIAARVAEEMDVTPSTMFSALRRLEREGYATVQRRKEIQLTAKGKKLAESILRRHFLTERLLTDLLGMDWVQAHQEAHRLEHAISLDVEKRLDEVLNHPATCPHGNVIPGKSDVPRRKGLSLNSVPNGREVVVQSVSEIGERDARLLGFLRDHELVPGARIRVLDVAPSLGIMSLRVGKVEFSIGIEAAKKVRVH